MKNMHETNLRALDLNLLVVLEVLLRKESVTDAAREIGLSQSAMSHALGRLRETFDDELLVRSGRTMVPTIRAVALKEPLREALTALENVVASKKDFDPATTAAEIVIAAGDYAQFVLLPEVLKRFQSKAPGLNLRIRELGSSPPTERLASGEIDLAFSLGLPEQVPPTLYRKDLFQIELVSVVRKDHPDVGETLDLKTFASLPHLLVSPRGDNLGVVDQNLARVGLERRVALVVPHFMIAPHLVANTNMVLTSARRVVESFASFLPLRIFPTPMELERGTLSMVWHPRSHRDPLHRWIRAEIEASKPWNTEDCPHRKKSQADQ